MLSFFASFSYAVQEEGETLNNLNRCHISLVCKFTIKRKKYDLLQENQIFFPKQGEFVYFPFKKIKIFSLRKTNLFVFLPKNENFPPTNKSDNYDTYAIVQKCLLREKNKILQFENHIFP